MNLLANQLGVSAPMLDEVIEFAQCNEKVTEFECSPYNLWASVLPTSSLSPLARLLSSLPCSQASVERVFSAADWAVSNRERVDFLGGAILWLGWQHRLSGAGLPKGVASLKPG